MPRKPTLIARAAKTRLREMVDSLQEGEALPILAELGKEFNIHPSTVFRILRDLVTEGVVWQSPSGKFLPASARASGVRGLPVCFIGREMWQWSRLYQELLEGVSEVCSANGSPLVLLSAPSLVRQPDPLSQPKFATAAKQKEELRRLQAAFPRPCGGILFDHLWKDSAFGELSLGITPVAQLVHGTGKILPVVGPEYEAATAAAMHFIDENEPAEVHLAVPFTGDPAIDHSVRLLRKAIPGINEHPFVRSSPLRLPRSKAVTQILLCPEDNIAHRLGVQFSTSAEAPQPMLFATQGTGTLHAPVSRLRFDFRRIGKSAASFLLHGTPYRPLSPLLLKPT